MVSAERRGLSGAWEGCRVGGSVEEVDGMLEVYTQHVGSKVIVL